MSDAGATPPEGGDPTVEDDRAKEVLGHGELLPILPGPEGSDYERYLRTDSLLALQKSPEEMLHRDELLFQTVHQSSELWLKLAVFETEEAIALIRAGDVPRATRLLGRANHCVILVTDALHMLERISPWEYHEMRPALGHGSGFDSPGWRRLRRTAQPLWEAFSGLLAQRGIALSDTYVRAGDHPDAHDLAEALIEWDERIAIWRAVHVKMVQRVIGGGAIGTQGTPVAVLQAMTSKELFPELWALRNQLTDIAGTSPPAP
jgi:tryptophan 2,3-dioxygenase